MPKFPSYPTNLPQILSPLNPRHYWLLFKWVFFRPSQLKLYLYLVAPDIFIMDYWIEGGRVFRKPALLKLYMTALIIALLMTLGLVLLAASIQSMPVDWADVIPGMAIGIGLGIALGVALGAAWGIAVGVIATVTLGTAMGLTLGAALGMSSNTLAGLVTAILWGLAVTTTLSAAADNVGSGTLVGVMLGGIVTLSLSLVMGITLARDWGWGLSLGGMGGTAVLIGATRFIFYLPELIWITLWRQHRNKTFHLTQHPAVWDELAVIPLPGLRRPLAQALAEDFTASLEIAARIAANPFQRASVQHALTTYLLHSDTLPALRQFVQYPSLDNYLIVPTRPSRLPRFPSVRAVLLSELSQKFTDGSGGASRTSEQIVWLITRWRREKTASSLNEFCKMLYTLLNEEAELDRQDLATLQLAQRFRSAYEDVSIYPHGAEVTHSWQNLLTFLEVNTLEQLGLAHAQLAWISSIQRPYLAPPVVAILTGLGDVSQAVTACLQATSFANKTVALNQAAGELNELNTYAQAELWPPERALFLALIKHWQSLVATEQGRLGENALRQMSPSERLATGLVDRTSDVWQRPAKPLANPYIAGDPVAPPLFVGRRDIFTKIAETWRAKKNPDSIIVYGHRRMGKSSILRNLDQAAPDRIIAYVNLQGETSFVASTADLLLALADRIYAEVKRARPTATLTQPPTEQFTTPAAAQIQFNRFMEQVRATLGVTGLILALDEFEAIEEAVRDGKVGKEIYQFLRAKSQEPWITLVFGGLHTLDEMSRDYAQPFYGSYQNIVVSYLALDDARHLITNPTPDFTVNYELPAVERIIAATGGQPYLVQLVCRDALDHLNHELFDEHRKREVKITLADVEAALGDDLFRRGTGYFDGVWTQVSEPAQQDLLRCMAGRAEPWALTELEEATHHTAEVVRQHLQLAERRDILRQRDNAPNGVWEFCVPLMRRWIIWKEQS
ncbi:hypothetical protein TFLX_00398 [Thermoflexales bacterium]|nr:hypothetical protein TFLX_00398 [Thermoflexales bacterium]